MTDKYVKIQSQQNANFTQTNNRVDFILPASYGKISLKDSFVQLYIRANGVDADPATGEGVYLTSLHWKNNAGVASDNYFNNVACIQNAQISSSNLGMIESIRRVGVLRQNLMGLRKTQTNVDSDRFYSGDSLKNLKNEQQYSIFQQVNKLGSVSSQNNDNVPLMIRLGDILNFCNADVVDSSLLGDVRLHLELGIKNIGAYQVFPQVITGADIADDIAQPAAPTPINSLIMETEFTNADQIPFYVGQKIKYTGTVNAQNGQEFKCLITSITQADNGKLTLGLNRPIFTLTATDGGCSNGVITIEAPASYNIEWNMAELVVKQVNPKTPSADTIMYSQFDTYELMGNDTTNYTNVIEVDGHATNCFIMPLNANDLDATLNVNDFRIALNNIELTDSRNVLPYSPLAYDRMIKAMENSDYVVKNLQNALYDLTQAELFSNTQSQIIGMPLFETGDQRKNLQVNIDSAGLKNFIMYTAVPRKIKL